MKTTVQKFLFFLFIVILVSISAYPNSSTRFGGYQLSASASEISQSGGQDDISGYISVGTDISDDGKVSTENAWRVRLFGPGMFYFYGLVISLIGLNAPLPLFILCISVVLWSLILYLYFYNLKNSKGVLVAALWLSVITSCSWLSSTLLNENLLGADNLAFILFVYAIYAATKSKEKKYLFVSGIAFGLITLISARYYALLVFGTIYVFSVFIFSTSMALLRKSSWSFMHDIRLKQIWTVIAIAFLVGVPWRIISSVSLNPGNYSLRASAYYWNQRWMSDQWMTDNGLQFLRDGGANSACKIKTELCKSINDFEVSNGSNFSGSGYSNDQFRSLALDAYSEHPFAFVKNRFLNFIQSWFFLLKDPSPQTRFFQVVSFMGLITCIAKGVASILHKRPFDLSVFALLALFSFVSPFTLYHIEYRYLQNIQMFSFAIIPFLFSSLKTDLEKNRKTNY